MVLTYKRETVKQIAYKLGFRSVSTIYARLKRGWCEKCAFTVPPFGSSCTHIEKRKNGPTKLQELGKLSRTERRRLNKEWLRDRVGESNGVRR